MMSANSWICFGLPIVFICLYMYITPSHHHYCANMAMEMDKIELMVELQVFTHIHDQRAVHRQFIPDTQ